MSDRDRHNPYDRSQQQGGGYRSGEGFDSPRQANQWQSESDHQQGGGWQQDSQRGGSGNYAHDYRFSGQSSAAAGEDYRSRIGEEELYRGQTDASRSYGRQGGGYGQQSHFDRERGRARDDYQPSGPQGRYGQNRDTSGYGGRDFDASGGNDFGSFTSEDYGGRDFSNRGGLSGGARSSESYRPSYGLSSWFNDDDDRGSRQQDRSYQNRSYESQGRGRSPEPRNYGEWRQYGESRGFFQRAGDEIASWFGDEDASRRRERDHRENHSGRGPQGYTRSDERIREDANDHLTHDWGVDASHITVSVKDGELTLDGTVDSRQAKRRAEDAVEHISGVKHVQNNLRVQDRSSASSGTTYGQSSLGSHAGSGVGSAATALGTGQSASSSGTTGASTTSGIGSSAAAGAGSASATRSSDKTS